MALVGYILGAFVRGFLFGLNMDKHNTNGGKQHQ